MIGAAGVGGWRLGFLARVFSWCRTRRSASSSAAGSCRPCSTRSRATTPATAPRSPCWCCSAARSPAKPSASWPGLRIHRVLPLGPIRMVDRSVGAALGAGGVLLGFWLFVLPWLVDLPGWPAQQARSSAVAQALDKYAPDAARPVPGAASPHRRPQLPRGLRQARARRPRAGRRRPRPASPPGVQERVAASTVKVEGEACNRIQEGSGFAAGADLVATNAHVVAGVRQPGVIRPDGKRSHGDARLLRLRPRPRAVTRDRPQPNAAADRAPRRSATAAPSSVIPADRTRCASRRLASAKRSPRAAATSTTRTAPTATCSCSPSASAPGRLGRRASPTSAAKSSASRSPSRPTNPTPPTR